MDIQVISLFPEMFKALDSSIPGRAQKQGLIHLSYLNPRDFTLDKHKTVDDKPYGGGPGMVMKFQPLQAAIHAAKQRHQGPVSYLSAQGKPFDQEAARTLSQRKSLILIAGRYEGVDQRLIDQEVDEEWSVGDFILSGGELAAMCLIDAIVRLQEGALGDSESALQDSFSQSLLEYPQYTRPAEIDNQAVPAILLEGDHAAISRWRLKQALGRTWQRRPDLLKKHILSPQEQVLLAEFIHEHSE
ncbi:tRNA (guanosine(37)-N1)-methyltransferase TrmD [Rickettsiella endosymbiont of Dermanyssus gallinae]|uniref:tRNA (guanosine(37)-N1)-methyltransferase TrmD n=1 Tax=Rickettsiella endosymbiont of Dermanyssus gallinae TaxID=2856608 RepID=UPI001C52D031|nr:tRNA (guanosine(37)-N1)-methyltransferase TrmD [Rickettsiella endosymbiont of Dermanyssus gallinae]